MGSHRYRAHHASGTHVGGSVASFKGVDPDDWMVPAQYLWEPKWSPEQRLWFEVIIQAARGVALGTNTRWTDARESYDWLRSPSETVGSFRWICYHLQREPECVRLVLSDANLVRMIRGRSTGRIPKMVA